MTMKQLEQQAEQPSLNPFYVSFSDLMVLLCAFFVMMIGMSKIDVGSFEKIRSGFTGTTEDTLVALAVELKELADGPPQIPGISIELAEDGVRLDLESAVLFETGSAVLRPGALRAYEDILRRVQKTNYAVDVEGHADDVPLFRRDGNEIETNWSLSGRRASTVIHHLQDLGIQQERLRVVGYSSTKPRVPVAGKAGSQLEKARSMNRRVSILVR